MCLVEYSYRILEMGLDLHQDEEVPPTGAVLVWEFADAGVCFFHSSSFIAAPSCCTSFVALVYALEDFLDG